MFVSSSKRPSTDNIFPLVYFSFRYLISCLHTRHFAGREESFLCRWVCTAFWSASFLGQRFMTLLQFLDSRLCFTHFTFFCRFLLEFSFTYKFFLLHMQVYHAWASEHDCCRPHVISSNKDIPKEIFPHVSFFVLPVSVQIWQQVSVDKEHSFLCYSMTWRTLEKLH